MSAPYNPVMDRAHKLPMNDVVQTHELSSFAAPTASSPTLYMPISSPPTPAPSPRPTTPPQSALNIASFAQPSYDIARHSRAEFASLAGLNPSVRRQYLAAILNDCTANELLFISTTIAPLLKRDFLRDLPVELCLHILSFIEEPRTLARASQVSHYWRWLLTDEWVWKRLCKVHEYDMDIPRSLALREVPRIGDTMLETMSPVPLPPVDPEMQWLTPHKRSARSVQIAASRSTGPPPLPEFSYRDHFKYSYTTTMNWRRGGHLLRQHRVPASSSDTGVVTSVALDAHWVVVGLANCRIHVFSARTGVLSRTLIGHEAGVWAVNLVSQGGYWGGDDEVETEQERRKSEEAENLAEMLRGLTMNRASSPLMDPVERLDTRVQPSFRTVLGFDLPRRRPPADANPGQRPRRSSDASARADPGKRSDVAGASEGWGQPNALVVSGGCDKVLRVWDVRSGYCIYVLHGHTSTIRCVKVLHNRPIAVTGSRDSTLRVWDIQKGRMLRLLLGHSLSVRCLDICGNKVVSGSYDRTCRLWDVDTGECLHVLRGHVQQIYSVSFDGVRIASGGLDTTVRVWDAHTGECLALLQGHTALVCQLQLAPDILATGGSDGRVITFSLSTYAALQKIAAHDSSVTSLQFDQHFLVTGGNDGRVRLFETATGNFVRDLSEPSESVWKVVWNRNTAAVTCKRAGKTVMEIWSFKPKDC
ncbi:hypothetical protein PLICRDRAFT_56515 [Plicaturopsis crispa FD-325 SS-3]|nr:hypothetical protein PLICRDRAFT_56515 [Plicaturopsis crispa FD-325 SS-3]